MKTRKATAADLARFETLKNGSANFKKAEELRAAHFNSKATTCWSSPEAFKEWDKAIKAWRAEYAAAGFYFNSVNLRVITSY